MAQLIKNNRGMMKLRDMGGFGPIWLGLEPFEAEAPFILTCPHSGEAIPPEAGWLEGVPLEVLLRDVDRFVDELYTPSFQQFGLSCLASRVHRYASDLNRYPEDVDASSVEGAAAAPGAFSKGYLWVKSTVGEPVMKRPISQEVYRGLVARFHDTFHAEFLRACGLVRREFPQSRIFHLDLHSMPSKGTGAHADAGSARPDVVLSDFEGKSRCSKHTRSRKWICGSRNPQSPTH
jgi:N-formylglutamate amidohydrolase